MPRIHHGVYSTLSCTDLRSNSLVRQVDKVQGDLNFAEEVPPAREGFRTAGGISLWDSASLEDGRPLGSIFTTIKRKSMRQQFKAGNLARCRTASQTLQNLWHVRKK